MKKDDVLEIIGATEELRHERVMRDIHNRVRLAAECGRGFMYFDLERRTYSFDAVRKQLEEEGYSVSQVTATDNNGNFMRMFIRWVL